MRRRVWIVVFFIVGCTGVIGPEGEVEEPPAGAETELAPVPEPDEEPAPDPQPEPTVPPTPAPPGQGAPEPLRVTDTGGLGLRLRAGPGTGYAILDVIPEGCQILPTGIPELGWLPVDWRGAPGWVFGRYVEHADGAPDCSF